MLSPSLIPGPRPAHPAARPDAGNAPARHNRPRWSVAQWTMAMARRVAAPHRPRRRSARPGTARDRKPARRLAPGNGWPACRRWPPEGGGQGPADRRQHLLDLGQIIGDHDQRSRTEHLLAQGRIGDERRRIGAIQPWCRARRSGPGEQRRGVPGHHRTGVLESFAHGRRQHRMGTYRFKRRAQLCDETLAGLALEQHDHPGLVQN